MEAARQTAGRTGRLWWSPTRAHTDHTHTRRFVGWRQLSPSEPGRPVRGKTGTDARAREGTRVVRSHGPPLGKQPHHITAGPRRPPVFTGVEAECGRVLPRPRVPADTAWFFGPTGWESSRLYMPRAASPLPSPKPGAEGTSGARDSNVSPLWAAVLPNDRSSRRLGKQQAAGRARGHRPQVSAPRADERHDSLLIPNFNRPRPATGLSTSRARRGKRTGRSHLLVFHSILCWGVRS